MTLRFLVDECGGPSLARWLIEQGHDTASVYDQSRGVEDPDVLAWAVREDRNPVTADKDFGDLIFRDGLAHRGVLLLRLDDERSQNKIYVTGRVLAQVSAALAGRFTVATETHVRARA